MSKRKKNKRRRDQRGVRPFWSGTLTFGLVSVPVDLYAGQRSGGVAMRTLAPDGTPLSRRFYCPEHKKDVDREHLVRGFELESGEYVVVSDEELQAAEPKKTREIDLREFVPIDQAPPLMFERSYFLTPAGDSNKGYRLLAGAMEEARLAGIATFVMRGKEYLLAVLAERGILRAHTLRLAEEVRTPDDIGLPKHKKASKERVKEFTAAIKKDAREQFDPAELEDAYAVRVHELVERKAKSRKNVVRVAADADGDVDEQQPAERVDLLETIRRSLASTNGHGRQNGADGKPSRASRGTQELQDMTKEQLYERAKQLGIEGRSSMSKKSLARAIKRDS